MERHATVGGEFEGSGAGGVQTDLFHELLARVLVAYIDGVATIVVGGEHARVEFDDGDVQGVLTGVGGEDDGRSLDELPEDTVLLHFPGRPSP